MTSAPLPALQVVGTLLGAGLICGAAFVWFSPVSSTDAIALSPIDQNRDMAEPTPPIDYYDDEQVRISAKAVLTASPFVKDRSAFERSVAAPRKAATPKYNPQFVGTLGKGPSIKALVIWTPGQQPQSISIGDKTHWGVLTSATPSELQFEGEGGIKTLTMF